MSELREELLAGAINKKRIVALVLVSIILISLFAFSVYFVSIIFGTQREDPSKQKAIAPEEDPLLVQPPLPLSFLERLREYFENNPEAFEQLLNMFDGDIDNFDLSGNSQILLLLGAAVGYIYAEMEAFRFFNSTDIFYTDINTEKVSDILWRMECFNEFTGDEWQSTVSKGFYDFYPENDYDSKYSSLDKFRMQIPISPTSGTVNSMVLPALFPIPFIMEDSLYADNLDLESELTNLYKDDFNCTTIDLDFTSDDSVNMTYETFGLNLPSNYNINISAMHSSYIPNAINDLYLQLPPSINEYINSHPLFQYHYNILDTIIDDNDNAFEVANKIRNYLQSTFVVGYDALMNDPQEDEEDIVDWFLEHEEGLWGEWASTFCAFTRAFNVPSRFVDGFRTDFLGEVEQIYDSHVGRDAVLIKNKHLYNWAEIYVPTDVSGNGQWVQMDVIFDNFGGEPIVPPIAQFNIELTSNISAGFRGQMVNFIATLSSPTGGVIANRIVSFYDQTSEVDLGNALTDQNGNASLLVNFDDSHVVGPHLISASYQLSSNYTFYILYGNIDISLTSVDPTIVNRSISNTTRIQGFVNDPIANQPVKNATVEFLLLEPGTNNQILNPFDIFLTDTDDNGNFDEFVNINPSVPRGNYEIRADFNGSWAGQLLAPGGIMDNSSNRIEFNVTEEFTYILLFSINGTPTNYPYSPILGNLIHAKRGEQLNLSVTLIEENTLTPVQGETVEFYDYTNNDVFIGSDTTNSNGIGSISYDIVDSHRSGPTLVYARCKNKINYSYYILNESITFDFFFGPTPREINRTGTGTEFDILCHLVDDQFNLIRFSQIDLRMFKGVVDHSDLLNPQYPLFYDAQGIFNINNMQVQSYTDATNYTLYLNFYGDFLLTTDSANPYAYDFFIYYLSTSFLLPNQLKVIDPENVNITLAIEGDHTLPYYDDLNKPKRYNHSTTAHFQVQVFHVFPLDGNPLNIYDDFESTTVPIDSWSFPSGTGTNGFIQFNISTASLHAGLHKIRVQYHTYSTVNTTYIIINDSININAYSTNTQVLRGTESFTVYGSVQESGINLRGLRVTLILLNSSNDDVSSYLNLMGPQSVIINNDGTYSFTINSIDLICIQGAYKIRIDFNGSIQYPDIPSPEVLLSDYMIHSNSSPILLNITAGTVIIQGGYHTEPHDISQGLWWVSDTCYIYGNLTWDNGTAMANMKLNVTIQWNDGNIITFNDTITTDQYGGFNASFIIDERWPDYVSDTKIIVYFEPKDNNLEYVENSELEFI